MSLQAPELKRIITACERDPIYFASIVAPRYFTHQTPSFHKVMLDEIDDLPKKYKTIVIEARRGSSKTFIVSTIYPMHRAVLPGHRRRPLKYALIGSYSRPKAVQIVNDYRNIIIGEPFQWMFPDTEIVKDSEDILEVRNKTIGFNFMIQARGRGSQVAGMRYLETRPQIFIGDDLEDPEEALNQKIVDDNVRWVDEVVAYSLDPQDGRTVLIGTPFAHDCTTQRIGRRDVGVKVIRFPGLVDTVEMSTKLGIPIGNSIWEDRFPTEAVKKDQSEAIANGTLDTFLRQVMLDPRPPGTVRIPIEKIKFFDPKDINIEKLNFFILGDYAYSRQVWADESAIVVVGVDDESNHYVFLGEKGKWGDIKTTERIIEQVRKYKDGLKLVGIESRSYSFSEKMLLDAKRNEHLNFGTVELKPANRSKAERIKALIPLFEDGRVYFSKGHTRQLEDELSRFRGEEMRHGDDLMDAFAYMLDVGFKPITQKTKDEMAKEREHKLFQAFAADIDKQKDRPRKVRSVYRDEYY